MILITGANSLLGTNVVIELLERGYELRSMVRRTNEILDKTDVFVGDVSRESDLRRAMDGCSAVIHIAAVTAQNLLHLDDYRFNWECAATVARVAAEMGVERLVLVSSANTVGNGSLRNPATEDEPLRKPYADSLYARSKLKAEKVVLEIFPQTVIVNPGFMLGAYDAKPSSGEIIMRTVGRSVVFAPAGGKSFVHVRDVASAIAGALTSGHYGERYLATGASMSVRDFYKVLQRVTGRRFRTVVVPAFILVGVGYAGDLLRKCGIRTPVSSTNMRILCCEEYYCNDKAVSDLSMSQSCIEQAVADAAEWFGINRQPSEQRS